MAEEEEEEEEENHGCKFSGMSLQHSQSRSCRWEKHPAGFSPSPPNFGIFHGYLKPSSEDSSPISWEKPGFLGMSRILGWQFQAWSSWNSQEFLTSPQNNHSQISQVWEISQISQVWFPCRKMGFSEDSPRETLWNLFGDLFGYPGENP